MLVCSRNQAKQLIIDGGSCVNIVSSSMVERLKFLVEPHPQPYKVAWIDNTSILVTHRCLISFSSGIFFFKETVILIRTHKHKNSI